MPDANAVKLLESLKPRGRITVRGYKAGTKELISESVTENLIMTGSLTGRDLFVQLLIGSLPSNLTGGINWIGIGTSSTPVAATNTQLGAEVARATVAFSEDVSFNEAILQCYIPDLSLPNQTYNEVGSFVNGTIAANSGTIVNHAILSSPYVKISGQDTTIEIDFTFT